MTPEVALGEIQLALRIGLLIAGPLLLAELVAGIAVGLLQAVTQVQEQSISFVAKLVVLVLVVALAGPWMLGQLTNWVSSLIARIPQLVG
ncbi:MAG: flagellar biosynthetic protein FliQ [Pseudomonadota bacterium]|jgi:flagellar biosynthetic protein FliQ